MTLDEAVAPRRIVNAVAPIRICDHGGWTDTWFAGHGRVVNMAVEPGVEVQIAVHPRWAREHQVELRAENYGDRYAVVPGQPSLVRHPLLEAAIDEVGVPDEMAVEISIHSEVPAGCSTGTSAAVTVALTGALDHLAGGRRSPREMACLAHRIEAQRLALQSGIQDQLCSAYGGICDIEMHAYPHATVTQLDVADATWWELERRLALVFLGRTHVSSAVHERVITELEGEGSGSPRLEALRQAAVHARDALLSGDLAALGAAMVRNTAAQAALHPALVSPEAATAIDVARAHGALGWKVNGAGGDGGSVTLLAGPSASQRRRLLSAVVEANPRFQLIPIRLSRTGLRVWESA